MLLCTLVSERQGTEGKGLGRTDLLKMGNGVFWPICAGEDDGYLLTLVTDAKTGESAFHVYDAATMAEKPVGRVSIPHRIPYGFHALHMNDGQVYLQLPLHKQLESLANVRVKMTGGCIPPVRVAYADEAWRPRTQQR